MDLHQQMESLRKALDEAATRLDAIKGDLPGHAFHGNQWTGGGEVTATMATATAENATKKAEEASQEAWGKHWFSGEVSLKAEHDAATKAVELHADAAEAHAIATKIAQANGDAAAAERHGEMVGHHLQQAVDEMKAGYKAGQLYEEMLPDALRAKKAYDIVGGKLASAGLGDSLQMPHVEDWIYPSSSSYTETLHKIADQPNATKGDVVGHAFHGNQWTSGSGSSRDAAEVSSIARQHREMSDYHDFKASEHLAHLKSLVMRGKGNYADKILDAAKAHIDAREAHKEAANAREFSTDKGDPVVHASLSRVADAASTAAREIESHIDAPASIDPSKNTEEMRRDAQV